MHENVKLHALREFVINSILPKGYHFPDILDGAVSLSPVGEAALPSLRSVSPSASDADTKIAALGRFALRGEILIDLENTDIELIQSALSQEIRERRIQYPWIMGRQLSQAFISEYGLVSADLQVTHEMTVNLLAVVPQGVFQLATLVVGPFGILQSQEHRYFPPSQNGPSVLCDRPECDALHEVKLETGETSSGLIYGDSLFTAGMTRTQIREAYDALLPDERYYRLDSPEDLPFLLGNGLTSQELRVLLQSLLRQNVGSLRENISSLVGERLASLPNDRLVNSLSDAHAMQLSLTVSDENLVKVLEQLVDNGQISIAPSETRISLFSRRQEATAWDTQAQLSRLGVRFLPRNPGGMAVARTQNLLQSVFSEEDARELDWLLRKEEGNLPQDKISSYLRRVEPEEAIKMLLFSSRNALERSFEELCYGEFALPTTESGENFLLQKILWKLGHATPPPDSVDNQLIRFVDELTVCSATDSTAREERTRSAASNTFVELENLLSGALSFATWALLSDHYASDPHDRFVYAPARARAVTNDFFASIPVGFEWSATGNNTLYTLFQAYNALSAYCSTVLIEHANYVRPSQDYPTATRYAAAFPFPLKHTRLILDLRPEAVSRLLATMREVLAESDRSKICETRNRISHAGESFPSDNDISVAVLGVRRVLELLRGDGLLPIVYRMSESRVDSFGRHEVTFVDGSGDEVILYEPTELAYCDLPGSGDPQVIMKTAIFANTQQPARFRMNEETEWASAWRGIATRVIDPAGSVAESLIGDLAKSAV